LAAAATTPTVVTKYMDFSQMTTTTVAYKYQWVANKRQQDLFTLAWNMIIN
jgi:hypothetical protein